MRRLLAALKFCLTLRCPVVLPVPPQPATQAQPDPKVQTVYVTCTGKKYHRDECRYLAYTAWRWNIRGVALFRKHI